MKLVLLRHGESIWNKENLFTGWTDVELSELGKEEARNAGRTLKEQGYDFDLCYCSYLKRAIHTLHYALDEMDRIWLPVIKSWKLNERHYGALQGLNKAETAQKYGEEQVKIWRRSFDVAPPLLEAEDERAPGKQPLYRAYDPAGLPLGESLQDTIKRVIPYYEQVIMNEMKQGKQALIVAVNIPTGIPLVYELDEDAKFVHKEYLGDAAQITQKMRQIVNQGSINK